MCVVEWLVWLRCAIILRNLHKSSKKVLSPSRGDVNSSHREACTRRSNNIATSCRLTVISPTGKWNECVSARHRSRNVATKYNLLNIDPIVNKDK
jgi:hypothetical protein